MAGAEADEVIDDAGEQAEGAALEVLAEPIGAPVVVALADVKGGEFVGEVEVFEG